MGTRYSRITTSFFPYGARDNDHLIRALVLSSNAFGLLTPADHMPALGVAFRSRYEIATSDANLILFTIVESMIFIINFNILIIAS
jgi:hypothetical protein